jgi:hypothetical protein
MNYKGSCHCARVAFEIEGEIKGAMACNCSMCQRRGSLLWFMPREALKLRTPAGAMGTYTFHKHVIKHHFCPDCGIHVFGEAKDPKGNDVAAINIRVIEGIDLDSVPVKQFDGRAK